MAQNARFLEIVEAFRENGAPSSDPARITARSQRAGPETGAPSTREYFLAPHYTP